TTFVVTSPCASSAAAHAVISAGTVATPSSASPKHAPSSKSHSGTIWATDSSFQAPRPFPTCQKSSSPEPNCPDRHHFCPSYRHWPKAAVLQIPAAGGPAGPAWLPGGGAAGPAWLPGGAACVATGRRRGPCLATGRRRGPCLATGGRRRGPCLATGRRRGPCLATGGRRRGPCLATGRRRGPCLATGGRRRGPCLATGRR